MSEGTFSDVEARTTHHKKKKYIYITENSNDLTDWTLTATVNLSIHRLPPAGKYICIYVEAQIINPPAPYDNMTTCERVYICVCDREVGRGGRI